jgi:hypothetical protein
MKTSTKTAAENFDKLVNVRHENEVVENYY